MGCETWDLVSWLTQAANAKKTDAETAFKATETVLATFSVSLLRATTVIRVTAGWGAHNRRVECRASCARSSTVTTFYVNAGTVVLKAWAARTWKFTGWSRACHGSKPTCVLRVQRSTRVKATFVPTG